jgi:hypothetical protein
VRRIIDGERVVAGRVDDEEKGAATSQAMDIAQEWLALDYDFVQACLRSGAGEREEIRGSSRLVAVTCPAGNLLCRGRCRHEKESCGAEAGEVAGESVHH